MASERISGKVAAILNTREVVLNVGAKDGVEVGMRFAILYSGGLEVRDPDSGEVIGSTEIPKTIVKVVRVDGDRISVGRTFRTIAATGLGALVGITGTPARVETLDVATNDLALAEIDEHDSLVKIGDVVVQTAGDEYDAYDPS